MIRVSKNERDYIKKVVALALVADDIIDLELNMKKVAALASVVDDIMDLGLNNKKVRGATTYDDLIALAEPIAKKLGTIGDPHTTMIIQPDHIRITSDVIGKPIDIDDDKSECK